jgi:hypothetical protein
VNDLLTATIYDHQPGVCAVPQRLLGNQVSGNFVIEWEGIRRRHNGSIVAFEPNKRYPSRTGGYSYSVNPE